MRIFFTLSDYPHAMIEIERAKCGTDFAVRAQD
jgi:hypothetical protein